MDIFSLDFDFGTTTSSSSVKSLERSYPVQPRSHGTKIEAHYSTEQIEDIAQKINQKHDLFTEIDRLRNENKSLNNQLESLRSQLLDLKDSSNKVQHIVYSEKHKAEYLKKENIMLQEKLKEAEEKNQFKISSRDLLVADNIKLSSQVGRMDSIFVKYIQLAYLIFHKNFKSIRAPIMIKNIREVQEYLRGLSSEKRHNVNHILSWNPNDDVVKVLHQYKSKRKSDEIVDLQKNEFESDNMEEENQHNTEINNTNPFPKNNYTSQCSNKVDVGTMFPDAIVYENAFIKSILQEMSKTFEHLTPIAELEPELLKRNCSTNTEMDYISATVKQNQSRPPSRIGLIKTENMQETKNGGVLKLWEILGQTIFELIQQGKNGIKDNEMGFFNDRMQVMVDFLQQGAEKPCGKLIIVKN